MDNLVDVIRADLKQVGRIIQGISERIKQALERNDRQGMMAKT